jgi:prevent-host-death family protein
MTTIPVAEVRGKFAALLGRVEAGEVVVISRHGRPVARLIGETFGLGEAAAAAWLERLRAWHGLQPCSPLAPSRRPERLESQGFLLDASVVTALLLPGLRSAAALAWLEQVGAAAMAVSAVSVLELERNLALARAARYPALRRLPQSWLEEPVPAWPAQQELLGGFLAERCQVAYPEPVDYRAATAVHRLWPGLGPALLLVELRLAERTGLMPVSFKPLLAVAAQRLGGPASVLTLAS